MILNEKWPRRTPNEQEKDQTEKWMDPEGIELSRKYNSCSENFKMADVFKDELKRRKSTEEQKYKGL